MVSKEVHRGCAYYSIEWSVLETASRSRIIGGVPSLPGIWELYWLEHSRIPRLIKMGRAWHGGVRHTLRVEADPEERINRSCRSYLASGDCYFRYTICENAPDLADVYSVLFSLREELRGEGCEPSGRYREVRIQEPEEMEIRRVRKPREPSSPAEPFGGHVPNMFDVVREMRRLEEEQSQGNQDGEDSPSGE
ncbi:hypothetical protein SAMN05920897_11476 [Alkalispirochaeta americana]|uniref:Uncharacterized protein n=1 Tax=Alkalispirochaeta americana TaxID=159291 RepID=A0A1N6VDS0_9SPIO|nr:hypothetical protein [Alkalispirochaeta americana]SIQ75917.1 hypothetical protein SAMN05920897_11476 [Alkalispirochaeta americana]